MRWCWLAVLFGCPTSDGEPVEADADTDADTDSDTDADTDADTDVGPSTDVSGVVTDLSGAPVPDANIRFCRGALCLTATTDAVGAFAIADVQALPHSFEVVPPAGSAFITGFSVVELTADVPKSLAMALPQPPPAVPIGPKATWVSPGNGLSVQVATTDLETPPFLDDATEVTIAHVDAARWPTMDGLTDVRAVWFLEPFDYPAPGGLPVEFSNDYGASDGEVFRVWVGSYGDSAWIDAGTVTASGLTLSGTAEIPLLSTVVLTGPE